MNLREIADAIEQTKAGYFAEIVGDVDKAKSEVWEIAHDSTRSTDWVKEQTDKAIERFNADRKAKAEAVAAKLEKLYQNGLDAAADVLAKQPTAGELAYLQAFNMKDRIIKTDVDSALRSLEHSAVASAVVCERAAACGIEHGKFVPGYIAVERVYKECLDADKGFVRTFGNASRTGSGSDMAFSSDSLREAMRAKYVANDFTNALRAVSGFE